MKIVIETTVRAPLDAVWTAWTTPGDIVRWNAASDDWQTTKASVDLRVGGTFSSRMEAKDGGEGFDFEGTYTEVVAHQRIVYAMADGREVVVEFAPEGSAVRVRESFDPESSNPVDIQRQGWQAILDRFARYVEGKQVLDRGIDPGLDAEIEDLDRQIEALKEARSRARRRRGPERIADHEVGTHEGARRLSELFGEHDDLLLVHNMGTTCAYCTLWADGFVGLLPHLTRRSAVVLLTPDPPAVQRAFAAARGWPFVMASDPSRAVALALGFATEDGRSLPGVSALRRAGDGSLVRTGHAAFGPGDDYCAVWPLFDLLEGGAGDWSPRL